MQFELCAKLKYSSTVYAFTNKLYRYLNNHPNLKFQTIVQYFNFS